MFQPVGVDLRTHQRDAIERLSNGKVLVGGVGTGKTITSLAYFYEKILGGTLNDRGSCKESVDLYILTTARKRDSLDWQEEAAQFGIFVDRENSVAAIKIVVDSWNNAPKYTEVKDAFFIFDEQRIVGSGAWVKAFLKIAERNRWILLSATPGDKWEDYIPLFIANGFVKNRTQFKRDHIVYSTFTKYPKVERYVGAGRLVRWRNDILVKMPYPRHTTRHIHIVDVDYDTDLLGMVVKKRWHIFENRPLRDVAEMFSTMRKVINSDPSRSLEVLALAKKHQKLIVFYNFDYELEDLRKTFAKLNYQRSDQLQTKESSSAQPQGCPQIGELGCTCSGKLHPQGVLAEWNGHKHEPVPRSDCWVYLVQYMAGAEAWNCIETDAMAFYSLTYSWRYFEQCQGRIDRMNTPFEDLHYYVLKSNSVLDTGIWRALLAKKDFNEKAFLKG